MCDVESARKDNRDSNYNKKNRQELKRAEHQFHERPISLLLFLEGTRFTQTKHAQQRSVYRNLLRPKLGGLAFSLEAFDDDVDRIVNVTVNYEGAVPGFWQFLCGRCSEVTVHVETIPLTGGFNQNLKKGSYAIVGGERSTADNDAFVNRS